MRRGPAPHAAGREDSGILLLVFLAEALNAARGIHQLLLPGEKGMTIGANVGVNLSLSRTGLERISASAANGRGRVNWMDVGLH